LPANVGLSLNEGDTLLLGKVVKCTTVSTSEILGIVKNTGAIHYSSFIGSVFLLGPTFFAMAGLEIFPLFGGELLYPFGHPFFIFFFRKMRTVGATASIGAFRVYSFAASPENAVVLGHQPSQIASDQLVVIGRVNKLNPCSREIKGDLRHDGSLGQQDIC
jgi:hypothetical protein